MKICLHVSDVLSNFGVETSSIAIQNVYFPQIFHNFLVSDVFSFLKFVHRADAQILF